jgi:hypothetical protein
VDDVILGAGGKLFTDDARKSMAVAIQQAETEANNGILKLTRWRAGTTEEVQLKLRVMGTYSATAPYSCPKSQRIFDDACKVLDNEPLPENWCGAINGLALLATGNPSYLPKLQAFARKMGPPTMKLERGKMDAWEGGYRTVFLSEYYLLTGDKEVLPAITELTVFMARGQGLYGTCGHGFSELTADGKLHGSIPPYGPVNAGGLAANLGIIMGAKCGVKDPEITPAIERACDRRKPSSSPRWSPLPTTTVKAATPARASVICGARSAPIPADLPPWPPISRKPPGISTWCGAAMARSPMTAANNTAPAKPTTTLTMARAATTD